MDWTQSTKVLGVRTERKEKLRYRSGNCECQKKRESCGTKGRDGQEKLDIPRLQLEKETPVPLGKLDTCKKKETTQPGRETHKREDLVRRVEYAPLFLEKGKRQPVGMVPGKKKDLNDQFFRRMLNSGEHPA